MGLDKAHGLDVVLGVAVEDTHEFLGRDIQKKLKWIDIRFLTFSNPLRNRSCRRYFFNFHFIHPVDTHQIYTLRRCDTPTLMHAGA